MGNLEIASRIVRGAVSRRLASETHVWIWLLKEILHALDEKDGQAYSVAHERQGMAETPRPQNLAALHLHRSTDPARES